jgi:hypothetical protein
MFELHLGSILKYRVEGYNMKEDERFGERGVNESSYPIGGRSVNGRSVHVRPIGIQRRYGYGNKGYGVRK